MGEKQGGSNAAEIQQPWRVRADGSVALLASRIGGRETLHFPPLPSLSPLAASSQLVELDSTAVLYSFTIVHSSPKLNKPPVTLGLVDFPQGVRVFGRLDLPNGRRPVIGERLRTVLQEGADGLIYAFKACEE